MKHRDDDEQNCSAILDLKLPSQPALVGMHGTQREPKPVSDLLVRQVSDDAAGEVYLATYQTELNARRAEFLVGAYSGKIHLGDDAV